MTRKLSDKVRTARFIFFSIGLFFSLCLVSFPTILPDKITERVLLIFIVSMLVTVLLAFEEVKITIHEQHDETRTHFTRVDDYLLVNELYRSLRKVEATNDALFYRLTRTTLVQLEDRLKKAENGALLLDTADTTKIAIDLANTVTHSLKTTVIWDTHLRHRLGKPAYLEALARAIQTRHVRVQRLFLIQQGVETDAALITRVKDDVTHGVEARYLHIDHWAATDTVTDPVDFGIWDGARVWIYTTTPAGQRATIHNDRASLDRYSSVFDANWSRGTPFPTSYADRLDKTNIA